MAITSEQTLDIMIQQFKVWLELEDAWQPPEGVDVEVFNAVKARAAMQHVHGNTEFAKVWYERDNTHSESCVCFRCQGIPVDGDGNPTQKRELT